MAQLNFYLADDIDPSAIRQKLNEIAAQLGYKGKAGPTAGDGNAASMLVALAKGEIVMPTRGMTMAEADAIALGLDPDTMTGDELQALHEQQQAKREAALLEDIHHEDNALRLWRSHRDPFADMDESRQHVIIDSDKPDQFTVSGNCPLDEFSTLLDTPRGTEVLYGRRIGLNSYGNTIYERLDSPV